MKVVIALNNEYVFSEIKKLYNEVHSFDITSKENVIEFLKNNENDNITLITKDNLEGNFDNNEYIKLIRKANRNVKLIYIVKSLDKSYKEFLFANEVFNIIEGKTITLDQIVNCINEDNKIIYKDFSGNIQNQELNEEAVEYVNLGQVISKKLIAIYGTSGSGKSYISSLISKQLSKMLDLNVSLLDMDIENPSTDIYNNIEQRIDSLNGIIEDMDNEYEISEVIDKYIIKDKKQNNLYYMTNNASIFDIQNRISNKYYNKIYNCMRLKFDINLVDLPSTPFLDVVPYTITNADIILFVVNPNYVSIRQAIKYLDLITKLWSVPKDSIKIIVNKKTNNSLDNTQISSLLEDYEIILNFNYLNDMDSYINGVINSVNNNNYNFDKLYNVLGINKNPKLARKTKFINRIIKSRC